jgi:hypothetical protein
MSLDVVNDQWVAGVTRPAVDTERSMNRRIVTRSVIASAVLVTALLAGTQPAFAATEQVRFNFEVAPSGQVEPGPWIAGCFTSVAAPADIGCIAVAGTGSVSRVQRPSGAGTSPAVKFPAPGAGKAVIQVSDAAHLDPGTADFTLTALVKLNTDEVSAGANVVQKGTFGGTTGGQWKLQVDGGVPSCRIAGVDNGLAVDAMATWSGSIAGAGWKFIECKRRGAVLSINVANSATPVNAPQNATMDITSSAKVFVGAKGTGTNNDQFHGAVDNVVFSVG